MSFTREGKFSGEFSKEGNLGMRFLQGEHFLEFKVYQGGNIFRKKIYTDSLNE